MRSPQISAASFFMALAALVVTMSSGPAQSSESLDTLFLVKGEKVVGRLKGLDKTSYRLEKPLPAPPNALPGAAPVFATVTIPRDSVDHVVFASNPDREAFLKAATLADLPRIAELWEREAPWLGVKRSSAAQIGFVYGDLLLRSGDPAQATKALALFQKIETGTWSSDDDMAARQGRLRAMVATGRAVEAVQEAAELAKISEDPAVLIEAKFILAAAADQGLRELVEENPRWTEDIFVIPERHRLYNEALDLYLYPGLFFGSESVPAARGLWGAVGIYQFTGEMPAAVEVSRDLVTIYPGSKYATLAQKFLDELPDELKDQDAERDARADAQETESPKTNEK